jgi:hypothetical protein
MIAEVRNRFGRNWQRLEAKVGLVAGFLIVPRRQAQIKPWRLYVLYHRCSMAPRSALGRKNLRRNESDETESIGAICRNLMRLNNYEFRV